MLGDIPMAIYYLGAGMFGWRVIIYTGRFITTRLIEVFSLSSDIASGIALIPSMISLCIYLGFVTMLGEKWMKHGTRLGYLRLFRIDSDD